MLEPRRPLAPQSALQRFRSDPVAPAVWRSASLCIQELPDCSCLRMQWLEDVPALRARIVAVTGMALPGPGLLARDGVRELVWLAPREWLWLLPGGDEQGLLSLVESLDDGLVVLTPAGASLVGIGLSGPDARALLATSCGIDLHPDAFVAPCAASTRLAQLPVLLKQSLPGDSFQMLVDRSHAAWLWAWLLDAAIEFGPPIAACTDAYVGIDL
jgi:sarcosine oxidase, subunit gamma